jgi:Na+-translocating ferredoxin:NAD+ oxidoreductase subunit B
MVNELLFPMLIMGFIGLVIAFILVYFDQKLNKNEEVDTKTKAVIEALPGNNCGACGYASCEAYGLAVSKNSKLMGKCKVGGREVDEKIADILGVKTLGEVERKVAVVHCKGGDKCKDSFEYVGVQSCKGALVIGNKKECKQGCMGFGDCKSVCKFSAISMKGGLPKINLENCVGCGKCVLECPLNLISLNSKKEEIVIECNTGLDIKKRVKACESSCIGCGICAKVCPQKAIEMIDGLPRIDYSKCVKCGLCVQKCPRKVISKYSF